MLDKVVRRGGLLVGAALLALAMGSAAQAGAASGKGRVLAKDLAARTVTISDHDTPIRVTPETVIVDASGKHITLGELKVMPQPQPGAYQLEPDAVVKWVADEASDGLQARRIDVVGDERD